MIECDLQPPLRLFLGARVMNVTARGWTDSNQCKSMNILMYSMECSSNETKSSLLAPLVCICSNAKFGSESQACFVCKYASSAVSGQFSARAGASHSLSATAVSPDHDVGSNVHRAQKTRGTAVAHVRLLCLLVRAYGGEKSFAPRIQGTSTAALLDHFLAVLVRYSVCMDKMNRKCARNTAVPTKLRD